MGKKGKKIYQVISEKVETHKVTSRTSILQNQDTKSYHVLKEQQIVSLDCDPETADNELLEPTYLDSVNIKVGRLRMPNAYYKQILQRSSGELVNADVTENDLQVKDVTENGLQVKDAISMHKPNEERSSVIFVNPFDDEEKEKEFIKTCPPFELSEKPCTKTEGEVVEVDDGALDEPEVGQALSPSDHQNVTPEAILNNDPASEIVVFRSLIAQSEQHDILSQKAVLKKDEKPILSTDVFEKDSAERDKNENNDNSDSSDVEPPLADTSASQDQAEEQILRENLNPENYDSEIKESRKANESSSDVEPPLAEATTSKDQAEEQILRGNLNPENYDSGIKEESGKTNETSSDIEPLLEETPISKDQAEEQIHTGNLNPENHDSEIKEGSRKANETSNNKSVFLDVVSRPASPEDLVKNDNDSREESRLSQHGKDVISENNGSGKQSEATGEPGSANQSSVKDSGFLASSVTSAVSDANEENPLSKEGGARETEPATKSIHQSKSSTKDLSFFDRILGCVIPEEDDDDDEDDLNENNPILQKREKAESENFGHEKEVGSNTKSKKLVKSPPEKVASIEVLHENVDLGEKSPLLQRKEVDSHKELVSLKNRVDEEQEGQQANNQNVSPEDTTKNTDSEDDKEPIDINLSKNELPEGGINEDNDYSASSDVDDAFLAHIPTLRDRSKRQILDDREWNPEVKETLLYDIEKHVSLKTSLKTTKTRSIIGKRQNNDPEFRNEFPQATEDTISENDGLGLGIQQTTESRKAQNGKNTNAENVATEFGTESPAKTRKLNKSSHRELFGSDSSIASVVSLDIVDDVGRGEKSVLPQTWKEADSYKGIASLKSRFAEQQKSKRVDTKNLSSEGSIEKQPDESDTNNEESKNVTLKMESESRKLNKSPNKEIGLSNSPFSASQDVLKNENVSNEENAEPEVDEIRKLSGSSGKTSFGSDSIRENNSHKEIPSMKSLSMKKESSRVWKTLPNTDSKTEDSSEVTPERKTNRKDNPHKDTPYPFNALVGKNKSRVLFESPKKASTRKLRSSSKQSVKATQSTQLKKFLTTQENYYDLLRRCLYQDNFDTVTKETIIEDLQKPSNNTDLTVSQRIRRLKDLEVELLLDLAKRIHE